MISQYAGSFLEGLLSFISPCVWILMAAYLFFAFGAYTRERMVGTDSRRVSKSVRAGSVFFFAGFAIIFMLVGAFGSGVESALNLRLLMKIAGICLIGIGLQMVVPLQLTFLSHTTALDGIPYFCLCASFIVGASFACSWIPCAGPMLGRILSLIAASGNRLQGLSYLFAYSLGMAIPFILLGFGASVFWNIFCRRPAVLTWGGRLSGLSLILLGISIFFGHPLGSIHFIAIRIGH